MSLTGHRTSAKSLRDRLRALFNGRPIGTINRYSTPLASFTAATDVLPVGVQDMKVPMSSRKTLCAAVVVCVALVVSTGMADRCVGTFKVSAVIFLPGNVVGWFMGWEQDKVRWYRVYYRDGFARALHGKGVKWLPPTVGEVHRPVTPAVSAWVAGFKAGRASGGIHSPPDSVRRFID